MSSTEKLWSHMKPVEKFLDKWLECGLPGSDITKEYRFHPDRKWRFDFAWPSCMTAVEIQGFGYGHQAQQSLAKDYQKWREAIRLGWAVVPFSTRCIQSRAAAEQCIAELVDILLERFEDDGATG